MLYFVSTIKNLFSYLYRGSLPLYLFLVLIIAPKIVWVLLGNALWGYDQAEYGFYAIKLYVTLSESVGSWIKSFIFGYMKMPMQVWLAQFFAPIGYWLTGSPAKGLLLFNILIQFFSVYLMFQALENIFKQRFLSFLGAALLASAPLLLRLSVLFFVEPLQLLTVVVCVYLWSKSETYDLWTAFLYLWCLVIFGLLVKISTPVYCVIPCLFILFSKRDGLQPTKQKYPVYFFFVGVGCFLTVLLSLWLLKNHSVIFPYLRYSAYSPIWGHIMPFEYKFLYWAMLIKDFFTSPAIFYALLPVFAAGTFHCIMCRAYKGHEDLFALGAVVQIIINLSFFSLVVSEISRYTLALLPYFVIMVCWFFSKIGSRELVLVYFVFLIGQFFVYQSLAFDPKTADRLGIYPTHYYRYKQDEIKEFQQWIDRTCSAHQNEPRVIVTKHHFPAFLKFYTWAHYYPKKPPCRFEGISSLLDKETIEGSADDILEKLENLNVMAYTNHSVKVGGRPKRTFPFKDVNKGSFRKAAERVLPIQSEVSRLKREEKIKASRAYKIMTDSKRFQYLK